MPNQLTNQDKKNLLKYTLGTFNYQRTPRIRGLIISLPLALSIYTLFTSLKFAWSSKRTLKNPALYLIVLVLLFSKPALASSPAANSVLDGTKVMITHPDMQAREITLSLARIKWGEKEAEALDQLISHESGWDPSAVNPNSGACGLFQNINCNYKSMSLEDQISWGFNYISHRYGTPTNAWSFWQELHLINGRMVHYY